MNAIVLNSHGGPEVLTFTDDFPEPQLKPGEALVRIEATSLNRVDTVIRKGYPGLALNYPHIPGGDIAGVIEKIEGGDGGFNPGDRVVSYPIVLPEKRNPIFQGKEQLNDGWQYFGMHRQGSYAGYAAVPVENLYRIPDALSFEAAATLPIAGLTAYHAIHDVGDIKNGTTFMIWGATGGMGAFAVQLAKARGAVVIATTGKNEKKQSLIDLGADYVFNHFTEDVQGEIMKLFPGGLDVILDYVGPDTFGKSFAMVRKGGRILLCGMLTGMELKFNLQQAYFRHISILGLYLGAPHEFGRLVELAGSGVIKPHIHTVLPLKEAVKAHQLMESGNYSGKIVLKCH